MAMRLRRAVDDVKEILPPPVRRTLRAVHLALRHATGPISALPDFLIIGAQRSGTSSLYEYLAQHPCLIPSAYKEVKYFANYYGRGLLWYRSHFPSLPRKLLHGWLSNSRPMTYEAGPNYLFHPFAASRAAEVVPHAKLIVLLRNPVDRAYSHYRHTVRRGFEKLTFEDAIAREKERLAPELEKLRQDPLYEGLDYLRFSYVSRGLYVDQLREWMSHFPRSQFLIEQSETFFEDPNEGYRRMLEFLQLPPAELRDSRNYSHARGGGTKEGVLRPRHDGMKPHTRQFLRELFAPHNERLYEFLGRRLSWEET